MTNKTQLSILLFLLNGASALAFGADYPDSSVVRRVLINGKETAGSVATDTEIIAHQSHNIARAFGPITISPDADEPFAPSVTGLQNRIALTLHKAVRKGRRTGKNDAEIEQLKLISALKHLSNE